MPQGEVGVRLATFGWTYLSRDALRRVEAHFAADSEGVRDEVGFLLLHQRYADRFFPGTSVLHTRLRYVLFVPWIYQDVWAHPPRKDAAEALAEAETRLVGRLKKANEAGVIGGLRYPAPSSQPPSAVYWTAMATWGVLGPGRPGVAPPSRRQVNQLLRQGRRASLDDDGQLLDDVSLPFIGVPDPPSDWNEGSAVNFSLRPKERTYLRDRLTALRSPAMPHRPSLLSRLADHAVPLPDAAWEGVMPEIAGDDRDALRRAGQAAALAAVGRGVYAALLEKRVEHRHPGASHVDHLAEAVGRFGRQARRLDLEAMQGDIGTLPKVVQTVLAETLAWLGSGSGDPEPLYGAYAAAEHARKGTRSRLPNTIDGERRRGEWQPELHPAPQPLHFRWWQVRRLIQDLHG